jgi:poly(3-hydroxybutyrate) depolymerase
VVAVAGSLDPEMCHPSRPVSVAAVPGTHDHMVDMEGGRSLTAPQHPYPPLSETLAVWLKADRCAGPPVSDGRDDLVSNAFFRSRAVRGAETDVERAPGCAAGTTVELWKMVGAGHIPLWNEARWPAAALDFLLSKRRAP